MNNVNGDRIAPPLGVTAGSVVTPRNWCGFLRPEFVLGQDLIHTDPNDTWWSPDARKGEDLLLNNALAFDVQVYDPTARWITDTSSGLVVGPTDAGYREVLNETAAIFVRARVSQGGFVDLAYPVLAGGSLRGWAARTRDRRSGSATDSPSIGTNAGFLISDSSNVAATTNFANTTYQQSLFQSGRLVINNAGNIVLFQPTFDTFTSFYERDGLFQDNRFSAPNYNGTIWTTNTTGADLGSDGLDTDGFNGADDLNEHETSAPMMVRPEAIRVTVRLENPSTRQLRQSSVVHRDER